MTVPDKDCPFARRKLLTVWVQLRVRRQCVCVWREGWVGGGCGGVQSDCRNSVFRDKRSLSRTAVSFSVTLFRLVSANALIIATVSVRW